MAYSYFKKQSSFVKKLKLPYNDINYFVYNTNVRQNLAITFYLKLPFWINAY